MTLEGASGKRRKRILHCPDLQGAGDHRTYGSTLLRGRALEPFSQAIDRPLGGRVLWSSHGQNILR